jgi:peptide/nickel transport system substrate-binding protein
LQSSRRLAVLVAFAGLICTSCAAGADPSSHGPKVLVVARVKDAISFDPAQATDGMSLNLTQEILKGLVEFKDGSFAIEPAIARSWSVSPDGKHWTFLLKRGLKFSDGTAVNAQAVAFNFNRWRLPNDPYHGSFSYGYYASMFGGFPGLIVGVHATAPDKVTMTLAKRFSPDLFLHDLAMPSFGISSPTAIKTNLNFYAQHPVGWGPYVLADWVKDDHITLTANPNYPGKPAYRTVIVRDIPDQATSVLEMQRGDVDMLVDLRPDDAALLSKQPGVAIAYEPPNNNSYIALNMDKPPFDKLAVRQAFAYALNVPAIVKAFYPKGAMVANNWTPPGMEGQNATVKAYPYDPARAKALLAGAGFANGISAELYYPTAPRPYMPEPQRIAEAIQADLRTAGINVTLEPLEFAVFLDKVMHGEHQICLIGWSGDNGDPDNFFYPILDKDAADAKPEGQNYAFWRDERFHALMMAGQASFDATQRAHIYREANAMVNQQVPAIPIVHVDVPIALKSSIAGYVPSPDTHIAFEFLKPKL